MSFSDHLHVALIVVDDQTRVLDLNASAEDLIGSSISHTRHQSLSEHIKHPEGWPSLLEFARHQHQSVIERNTRLVFPTQHKRHRADIALRQIDEQQFLIELHLFARADGIIRSRTLQMQAEHNQLLLRNLAHEIRNPLAGIKGAAQRVRERIDPDNQRYIDIIITQTDRLNALLKTMSAEGKTETRPENIHRVIEDAIAGFSSASEHQNIHISRHYDPSIPEIAIDAGQIHQVILNLLSNAAKASDYDGNIYLGTEIVHQYTIGERRHRHAVAIRVHDQGCGIPESLHTAIFQPMISHFNQGSGLGLAIVQHIVHQHHGCLELDSEPGKTCLSVILPLEVSDE
ncbi:ATP-binding protein [Suttonella sp. R2A3]|uniref:two-component system sensor histidine kinase NtrB n=1 Tax=Suttonella sp. R2A3 TaxID=2908648 RepID=UPI001F2BD05B|nr:ATP-binding protein [Suttonella sp. R2A3]UJF24449.1 ATP-binding protein [Suttonella sp. R2A3]